MSDFLLDRLSGDASPAGQASPLPHQEEPSETEPPLPYQLQWTPFPLRCLPKELADFAGKAAHSIGCDVSFVVLPMLAVLASCIGRSHQVEIKLGWWEPCVLWLALIAESGSGKSPAFKAILNPLRKLEDAMLAEHQADCDRILTTHAELNEGLKKSERTEPELPPLPRYTAADVTIEAMSCVLADNPLGLLLADDELSGWLGSFDQYKSGKGSDRSKWLQTYDAGRLTIDRKTGIRFTMVPHAAVSVCGGVQPGILRTSLSGSDYDSGLAARFLLAMPPDQVLGWNDRPMPNPEQFQNVLIRLLEGRNDPDLISSDGFQTELTPRTIYLTDAARELVADFKTRDVTRLEGITGPLRSAWAKSAGRVARLALIFHCVESGDEPAICADVMRRSIEVIEWFDRETERIYQALGVCNSPDAELLTFIRDAGEVTPRSLMQWRRSRFRTAVRAEQALRSLVDQGLLTQTIQSSGGGRPATVFRFDSPNTKHRSA